MASPARAGVIEAAAQKKAAQQIPGLQVQVHRVEGTLDGILAKNCSKKKSQTK